MLLTASQDLPVSTTSGVKAACYVPPDATDSYPPRPQFVRKLALSAAVWVFYVPYLAVLRLLGPGLGLALSRGVAKVHWLMTSFGAQRAVRTAIERTRRCFRTDVPRSSILRKHLELKHEFFARTKLFNRAGVRGGDQDQLIWVVDPAAATRFGQMNEPGKGLIIVGYHFGFFRLAATALARIFPGCDAVHLSHRMAHYASGTFEAVAQLALEKAYAADQQSGARIQYIDRNGSLLGICRMLLAGETLALAADGAFATDFLDVPFLDAKLRLPCGWARLAAATRSNLLILIDTEIDHNRRRVCLFDHVQVRDGSPEEIRRAVAESGRILDDFVRREPWAWHPWGRLRYETTKEGVVYYLATGTSPSVPRLRAAADAKSARTLGEVV